MVWCSLSITCVIEPYLFDDPIVSGDSYFQLLNNFFFPMLSNLPANTIFKHDGAPPQFSQAVQDLPDG